MQFLRVQRARRGVFMLEKDERIAAGIELGAHTGGDFAAVDSELTLLLAVLRPVEVEVDSSAGLPKTILVGLAETSVKESVHRIERALANLGFDRPTGPAEEVDGQVKWYDPKKGFGFVAVAGSKDVFIHRSVLAREGISELQEGQRIHMRVVPGAKGLEATSVEVKNEF